ncbi:MAG: hypothetical protein QNK23_18440 [Crocinitomicaceae bacterium]|nr:hypothetical protein [Crocinitomicaceae bacterium]
MKRILTILTFLLICAQLDAQKVEPKFTFNVELGLPVSLFNEPFDDIMQGLVNTSIYGQYSFPFHFHIGMGVRYTLWNINEFAVNNAPHGVMHTGGAFLKLGWDKFHSDRFATDFGVKFGYTKNFFETEVSPVGAEKFRHHFDIDAFLIEPTIGLILLANEQNSYRWSLGWAIQTFGFKPQMTGIPTDAGYEPSEFDKITQYLIVGFGYTYYFKSKKD